MKKNPPSTPAKSREKAPASSPKTRKTGAERQPAKPVIPLTGPRGGTTGIYRNERTGTTLARMTVYVSPELQRAVKQAALDQGITANALIQTAIKKELGIES